MPTSAPKKSCPQEGITTPITGQLFIKNSMVLHKVIEGNGIVQNSADNNYSYLPSLS